LPVGAFLALTFYLSSRPPGELDYPIPDYVAHGLEYLVLGLLLVRALNGGMAPPPGPRVYLVALLLSAAWAIGDEYHQSFVVGRVASVVDVVSDVAGVLIACLLFPWLRRLGLAWIGPRG